MQKLLFSNFGWFLAKVWVFIARKLQNKPTKNSMVPLQIWIFPIAKSCLKNPFFWNTKILAKFKKWTHSEFLSCLRDIIWSRNKSFLKTFQFLSDFPKKLCFVQKFQGFLQQGMSLIPLSFDSFSGWVSNPFVSHIP